MKRVTHIDGVPVRRAFYTHAAVTTHAVAGWRALLSRVLRRILGA